MRIDRIDEHNIRNVCLELSFSSRTWWDRKKKRLMFYEFSSRTWWDREKKRLMFYEDTHFASFLDWFDTMIAMDTGYL